MNKILDRIEREAGVPGLISVLAEYITPTDLKSILLEVYRLRSDRLQPSAVLANYENNRLVQPSSVSPAKLACWEQVAFSQLPPKFEAIALSPVCPFGTSSVVASVTQDWTVTTTHNTEVVSDSTNVLALECAHRRRMLLRSHPTSTEPVHLAASHRLLRAQHYDNPHLVNHFSVFALCSAGRKQDNAHFELFALALHIRFYLRALQQFLGTNVPLHLSITDFSQHERTQLLESRLLSPVLTEFVNIDCTFDAERTRGRGYYLDLCFHIHATSASGQQLELVDGGSVNWTQKFLSNAKERLIISGIGSERVCSEFDNV